MLNVDGSYFKCSNDGTAIIQQSQTSIATYFDARTVALNYRLMQISIKAWKRSYLHQIIHQENHTVMVLILSKRVQRIRAKQEASYTEAFFV